jgi:hypothetical protein
VAEALEKTVLLVPTPGVRAASCGITSGAVGETVFQKTVVLLVFLEKPALQAVEAGADLTRQLRDKIRALGGTVEVVGSVVEVDLE